MLMQERESLLKQIDTYDEINKECFERIKDLKYTCDKQFQALSNIMTDKKDLDNIR